MRPSLGEIQLGPERVHLEPRSMEVLLALVERAPEVVPKQALIDAVWGEAFVSDEVLTHAIWDLRRALGDNASDPEFIQTIPKRGYRLIAPVKPIGPLRRRATDRRPEEARDEPPLRPLASRASIWGAVAVAVLLLVGLWLGRGGIEPANEVADRGTVLVLTMSPPNGPESWGEQLTTRVARELAGPDLEVLPADSCAAAAALDADYCLETKILRGEDRYEAVAQLHTPGGAVVYSASDRFLGAGEELDAAAEEVGEIVRTFLQVIDDPYLDNPDVRPWIELQDHDIRAIRDFLLGVTYVYRHEIGGRHPMAAAMQWDPDFIAPRIWRTPSLVADADPETLAAHRAQLERLYTGASGFEKAMIRWALAFMDGSSAEQVKQLRIALERVDGNRPIEFVLGLTLAGLGDLEEAWRYVEPLVGQNWHHPGLYPVAAQIAVQRDRIDDIRSVLELALKVEPVDPEALAVMVLLAVYDEDAEGEERFRRHLERRRRELAPEEFDTSSVADLAESLAARADTEGRGAIAIRLRESAT